MNKPNSTQKSPDNRLRAVAAALVLTGAAVAYHYMPHASTLSEGEMNELREAKKNETATLTREKVKQTWATRSVELSDRQADNILACTKRHMKVREAEMAKGGYKEIFPGSHYPEAEIKRMVANNPDLKAFFEAEVPPISRIMVNGEALKNAAGEEVLAAEPMASAISSLALTSDVNISLCIRSDVEQAILYCGMRGDFKDDGPRVLEAGKSVHQTGLACDFDGLTDEDSNKLAGLGITSRCWGTLEGSDPNHGEMGVKIRSAIGAKICQKIPAKHRDTAEKIERVGKKAKSAWCKGNSNRWGCK